MVSQSRTQLSDFPFTSLHSCIAGGFFTNWAIREAHKPHSFTIRESDKEEDKSVFLKGI